MAHVWNSTIERRTPLKAKTSLARSQKPMKRSGKLKRSGMKRSLRPMNKIGRRTKSWRKAWRFLKPEFEKRGRTGCEFRFIPHECWGPIDPCHSKKRNKMKGHDIYVIALGCRAIHNFLDLMCTHEQMDLFVNEAIERAGGLILPEERKAA